MKFLVLLTVIVGAVKGQYHYNVPSASIDSSSSAISSTQALPSKEPHQFQGYDYNSGSSLSVNLGQAPTSSFGISENFGSSSQFQTSQTGTGSISSVSSGSSSVTSHLEPIIKKHYYVHVAPEEPEETHGGTVVNQAAPEKHYKIIFIKVPSYSASRQAIINAQAKVDEKTLIYVLSKTPDALEDIQLSAPEPTKPSKPEVFFIKYKTEKKINNLNGIQQAALVGGGSVDENQINTDLIAAGGLPEGQGSTFIQSSGGSGSTVSVGTSSSHVSTGSGSAHTGPLIGAFPSSSSTQQQTAFQSYGLPN